MAEVVKAAVRNPLQQAIANFGEKIGIKDKDALPFEKSKGWQKFDNVVNTAKEIGNNVDFKNLLLAGIPLTAAKFLEEKKDLEEQEKEQPERLVDRVFGWR